MNLLWWLLLVIVWLVVTLALSVLIGKWLKRRNSLYPPA